MVIAGFEPLDVMQAILMLVRQINEGRAEVENEFTRAVTRDGNLKAQALVADVFELRRSFEWRGLGEVPYSALRIRDAYGAFDAERRFGLEYPLGRRQQGVRMRRDPARREEARATARCSAPSARPRTRSARAWSRPKARAPRTTAYGRFREIPIVAASAAA